MGVDAEPRNVYAALRRLQSAGEILLDFGSQSQGRSIHLNVNQDGLKLFNNNNIEEPDADDPLDTLARDITLHISKQDQNRAKKVLDMHWIMQKVSSVKACDESGKDSTTDNDDDDANEGAPIKSHRLQVLQTMIRHYFDNKETSGNKNTFLDQDQDPTKSLLDRIEEGDFTTRHLLEMDVHGLLQTPTLLKPFLPSISLSHEAVRFGSNAHNLDYTVLTVTKILQGITSPRTPVLEWYQHPLWGKWRRYDFPSLLDNVHTILQLDGGGTYL
jgi:hypothetical protein